MWGNFWIIRADEARVFHTAALRCGTWELGYVRRSITERDMEKNQLGAAGGD